MRGVAGQHERAAVGLDADHLQAGAVAADLVQAQPLFEFGIAVMEDDTLGIDRTHHPHDILDVEGVADAGLAHVPAGREAHLRLLKVEAGLREEIEIAGMVIVEMRDDHVLHRPGIDAELAQCGLDGADQGAATLGSALWGEAGVDHDDPPAAPHDPDEIVHGHGRVVRIGRADEVLEGPALMHGIAQGEDLPAGHRRSHLSLGTAPSAFSTSWAALKASRPAGMPQ